MFSPEFQAARTAGHAALLQEYDARMGADEGTRSLTRALESFQKLGVSGLARLNGLSELENQVLFSTREPPVPDLAAALVIQGLQQVRKSTGADRALVEREGGSAKDVGSSSLTLQAKTRQNPSREISTNDDPLRAFLSVRQKELANARPFEGGEHLWIGNEGAARANKKLKLDVSNFGPFKRKQEPEALTYGEIVAFAGDFYESPADLFNEQPSSLDWLWQPNDLVALREAFTHELTWIKLPPEQRKTSYPDENLMLWWNAKQYAELALRNNSHFGWHNALAYVRWHEAALELAARAAKEPDPRAKSLLWREAVYTNGFADHFLTDGFAAGHVRTPAAQIRRWAEDTGKDERFAGALVKRGPLHPSSWTRASARAEVVIVTRGSGACTLAKTPGRARSACVTSFSLWPSSRSSIASARAVSKVVMPASSAAASVSKACCSSRVDSVESRMQPRAMRTPRV
jgi:hypothetical protein